MPAPRGELPEETLRTLVERDLSVREIAAEVDRSPTTVRYWLQRHGLATTGAARNRRRAEHVVLECARHGLAPHVTRSGTRRCARCLADAVTRWRRRAKRILVEEAGGRCVLCGYDRCVQALQFHHVDPARKRFAIGGRGLARSIDVLREEAAKCALVCSNCHVEIEAGMATLP